MESQEVRSVKQSIAMRKAIVIRTLFTLNAKYNEILVDLRRQRVITSQERARGNLGFLEYWSKKMSLEDKIREMTEKRNSILGQISKQLRRTSIVEDDAKSETDRT